MFSEKIACVPFIGLQKRIQIHYCLWVIIVDNVFLNCIILFKTKLNFDILCA